MYIYNYELFIHKSSELLYHIYRPHPARAGYDTRSILSGV